MFGKGLNITLIYRVNYVIHISYWTFCIWQRNDECKKGHSRQADEIFLLCGHTETRKQDIMIFYNLKIKVINMNSPIVYEVEDIQMFFLKNVKKKLLTSFLSFKKVKTYFL